MTATPTPPEPDDDDRRGGRHFAGQHDQEPDVPAQPHPDDGPPEAS